MPTIAMAMPVLPGKEQVWRDYVAQLNSADMRDAYVASRREVGMTRETVWSQEGPDGQVLAVVMMETEDPDMLFTSLATSDDPFTRRFREFISEVHGFDITTDPLPQVTMLNDTRF